MIEKDEGYFDIEGLSIIKLKKQDVVVSYLETWQLGTRTLERSFFFTKEKLSRRDFESFNKCIFRLNRILTFGNNV